MKLLMSLFLDPSLLAFFKSRKQQRSESSVKAVPMVTDDSTSTTKTKDIVERIDSSIPVKDIRASIQSPETSNADVPMKPKKKWLHMDVVEEDKLNWTKDLPPPPKADYSKVNDNFIFTLYSHSINSIFPLYMCVWICMDKCT